MRRLIAFLKSNVCVAKKLFVLIGVLIATGVVYSRVARKQEQEKWPSYYQDLAKGCEQRQKTEEAFSMGCCMASVKRMVSGSYTLMPSTGCSTGYRPNGYKCIESYRWCEPAEQADTKAIHRR